MAKKSKQTKNAQGAQNKLLQSKIGQIRSLLNDCSHQEALARFNIAVEIAGVVEGRKYGSRAVAKLAKALGWSEDKVGQYAAVPKTWSLEDFKKLLSRKNSLGKPLSWSHFVALAQMSDAKPREAATRKALEESMSVRDLNRFRMPESEAPARESSTASSGSASSQMTSATASVSRKVSNPIGNAIDGVSANDHANASNATAWCRDLCRKLDQAEPTSFNQELLDQLIATREGQQRLAEAYLENARQIGERIAKIEGLLRKPARRSRSA